MSFSIRAMKVPDDYAGVAATLSCWTSDPVSADILIEEDRKIPEQGNLWRVDGKLGGHDRRRWVAVSDEDGTIAGFGGVFRAPWNAPGELWHSVVVRPEYRELGIGGSLYAYIEEWARSIEASQLLQSVRENDQPALSFALKRGFAEERKTFESKLDLSTYYRPDLEALVAQVEAEGIRFFTLADEPGEASQHKLYELCKVTHPDIPGFNGGFPDFIRWKEWNLELTGSSPETVLIAADGDRIVGLVNLLWNNESRSMYHEYTCTDKEYRGRHIALALKLIGIRVAQEHGARYLRTHNDSLNAPMLRINRDRIGFEAEPGLCRMLKNLDT